MTEDEFDPLPADMMRAQRAREVGKMWGTLGQAWSIRTQSDLAAYVPNQEWSSPEEDKPDLAAIRDLSVIARRKAGEKRHIAAIAGTTEWVHDKPNLNDGRLPEAAFDWPIYRAATDRLAQARYSDSDALRDLSESELRALHGDR